MSKTETSSETTIPRKVLTVRPISWRATIPQLVALVGAIAIGWAVTRSLAGANWGIVAYLLYSFGSRSFIAAAHRRGIRLSFNRQFEEAILAYKASYEFFTRHLWLDRFRSITMMTPAAISYREMALINIAVAYVQIGQTQLAKEYYERALVEFPESELASASLKMMESAEQSPDSAGNPY